MMESIAQQAAKDARDVFSDDRQAQTAISYMEQLVYAALRNVEYDLSDPVTVHANMLRGTIAKPTVEQIIHLYGVDALTKALAPVIVREAALTPNPVDDSQKPDTTVYAGLSGIWSSSIHANHTAPDPAPHVNKTLKAEHDADNTLTDPAAIREAALRAERDALIHDIERIKDSETYHLNRAERLEAALRQIAESNFIGRAEGYALAALKGADHE